MNALMENGVWIRVADLAAARDFYRTVFQFDQPLLETPECCVFLQNERGDKLVLERSDAPYLEHGNSANSWFIAIDDVDAFCQRLKGYKIELCRDIASFGDFRYHRACDIEGNLFVICEKISR